jgi:ribosomal protein S18 acetylase RimI-like enzyme
MGATLLAPRIEAARPADRADLFATLTVAFEADPAVRQLYPDTMDYRRHFPVFAELFAGPALADGTADRTADGLGAALCLAPGVEPDPEPLMAHLKASLPVERQAGIFAGFEAQDKLHPHIPHWYLPFVGVRPEAHRCGIGAGLLAHGLARADRDRMPAYLEATSRTSVPLYRRFGFEVIGVIESPGYPEIFAMWRPGQY